MHLQILNYVLVVLYNSVCLVFLYPSLVPYFSLTVKNPLGIDQLFLLIL